MVKGGIMHPDDYTGIAVFIVIFAMAFFIYKAAIG